MDELNLNNLFAVAKETKVDDFSEIPDGDYETIIEKAEFGVKSEASGNLRAIINLKITKNLTVGEDENKFKGALVFEQKIYNFNKNSLSERMKTKTSQEIQEAEAKNLKAYMTITKKFGVDLDTVEKTVQSINNALTKLVGQKAKLSIKKGWKSIDPLTTPGVNAIDFDELSFT